MQWEISSRTIPMKIVHKTVSRRTALSLAAGAAGYGLLRLTSMASAQNYPDRPVKLLVPFAAGGPTDMMGA
jgi:tripartite-type tricarboxylate transporter receptor subunit TctC